MLGLQVGAALMFSLWFLSQVWSLAGRVVGFRMRAEEKPKYGP